MVQDQGAGTHDKTQISPGREKTSPQKISQQEGRGGLHTPHLLRSRLTVHLGQNRLRHECGLGKLCTASGCPRELPTPLEHPVHFC